MQNESTDMEKQGCETSPRGRRVKLATLALSLAVVMGAASFAYANGTDGGSSAQDSAKQTDSVSQEAQNVKKDEVIYTKLDASGNKTGVYAVNEFQTDEATRIVDAGNYSNVQNLSTSETIKQNGKSIEMTTLAGKPTYYEGYMDTSTQLPWNIKITYYLNGEKVDPNNLYNANGDLEIVLDIDPASDVSGVSDFANSFVMQAQGTFSNSSFKIEEATDATIVKEGSSTTLTYLILPGGSGSYHIKGKASDFEYSGWQIAGMSLSMSIDLSKADTSELSNAAGELESATTSLADGSASLADGISSITSGAASGASGAAQLDSGVQSLQSGTAAFASGISKIKSGSDTLESGVTELSGGLSTLDSKSAALTGGWNSIYGGIGTLSQSIASAQAGTSESSDSYKQALAAYSQAKQAVSDELAKPSPDATALQADIENLSNASATLGSLQGANGALSSIATGVDSLDSGAAEFDGGLASYTSGVSALSSGSTKLVSGADSLSQGLAAADESAGTLASGAKSLASGTSSLSSGLTELASGSQTAWEGADALSSGSSELAKSVSELDKQILDSVQATIDEKLGKGFQVHSFVDSSNTNVKSVEFVYVSGGVEKPSNDEKAAEEQDSGDDGTIIDRIVALFTGTK